MDEEAVRALSAAVPARFRQARWTLLYSTARDGISLQTMLRNAARQAPTVLVVRDFDRCGGRELRAAAAALVDKAGWRTEWQAWRAMGLEQGREMPAVRTACPRKAAAAARGCSSADAPHPAVPLQARVWRLLLGSLEGGQALLRHGWAGSLAAAATSRVCCIPPALCVPDMHLVSLSAACLQQAGLVQPLAALNAVAHRCALPCHGCLPQSTRPARLPPRRPAPPLQASLSYSSWSRVAPCGSGGGAVWPGSQTTISSGAPPRPSRWVVLAGEPC